MHSAEYVLVFQCRGLRLEIRWRPRSVQERAVQGKEREAAFSQVGTLAVLCNGAEHSCRTVAPASSRPRAS